MKGTIVLGVLVALIAAGLVPDQAFARAKGSAVRISDPSVALTQTEVYWLTYLREEEKLARDVYLSMSDIWGTRVFARIATAEQRHMDAIGNLLDKYGLPDPARNEVGAFTNADLQALYDQFIRQGRESELNAVMVGVAIEEANITDLNAAIAGTDKADLQQVYTNLLRASRAHLSTFLAHE
jgi:hypothetical protein